MNKTITLRPSFTPFSFLFASFLFLSVFITFTSCELQRGEVSSEEGFHYLGKFCYDFTNLPTDGSSDGTTMTLSVSMSAPLSNALPGMRLYVFDDQDNSWPAVYHKDIPCAVKITRARNSTPVVWDKEGHWRMPLARIHEHVRPRFWYIVLANCIGFRDVSYEIRFINQGSDWNKQFGVNEQGLNTLYLIMFIIYMIGLIIQVYAIKFLWKTDRLHPIVKMLFATISLQFASIFCYLVHYCTFVADGLGVPPANAAGEILNIMARLCFVMLLILIAQGWTISTDELKHRTQIFVLISLFATFYATLLIWDVTGRDPASTLYVYESVPGLLIVGLDVLSAVWFIVSIHNSHTDEQDPDKIQFYEMIGCGFVLWFVSLPATVGVATLLHPWVREITVTAISMSISTLAYASLAALLWPTRAERYFKINTPDVMDSTDDL